MSRRDQEAADLIRRTPIERHRLRDFKPAEPVRVWLDALGIWLVIASLCIFAMRLAEIVAPAAGR